jgi:hydrogenase maturation protein HypF
VQAAVQCGATRLALTGGCFHNRLLSREVEQGCRDQGIRTWRPSTVDCGDAGLALGQAWLVAHAVATPRWHAGNNRHVPNALEMT